MRYARASVPVFVISIAGAACHATTAPVAAPGAPSAGNPPEPIQQAEWVAGHWEGEGLGGWNETLWSPPRGGSMMGVFRHYRDGKLVFYEILTLRPVEGRLVLTLRHFNPDLTAWEEPEQTVTFPLIRAEPDALHFDGLTYRRTGPDQREVTVMLGPKDQLRPETFTYRRVRGTTAGR